MDLITLIRAIVRGNIFAMRSRLSLTGICGCLFYVAVSMFLGGCGTNSSISTGKGPSTYPFTSAPSYLWLQQFGASDLYVPSGVSTFPTEIITALATDPTGDVVASGYDLGSLNGASNPGQIAENFVIKFNTTGAKDWAQQFGTGSGDFLQSVGVDTSGNIYAVGVTRGALPGYSNPTAIPEGALYKLSSSGSLIWEQQFTIQGQYTSPFSLTVDPTGAVIIGGVFSPATDASATNLFFQKIDGTSGSLIWQTTFGTNATDSFQKLTCDADGEIYAIGQTTGAFPGQSTGMTSPFLIKLAGSTGAQVWVSPIPVTGMSIVFPFSVVVMQNAVIIGGAASNSSVTIGSSAYVGEEGFLTEFSSTNGSSTWNKVLSTGAGDAITGVSASSGNIYATGETNGLFAAGFSQPEQDMMLLTFALDGTDLTAVQFGTGPIINQTAQIGPQIVASATGQVYVAGPVQTPFPGFSNPSNSLQLFVTRFQ